MLNVYWKHATAESIGPAHGLTPSELATAEQQVTAAHAAVVAQAGRGELGYVKLPDHPDYARQVHALAAKHRPNTTDLVVLGIGGSALGNIAVQQALSPATYNLLSDAKRPGPRLFVLDNVDPALVDDTLKLLGRRLKSTLVNVISKSGETAETASQFLVGRELLRTRLGAGYAERIVATTDAGRGTMHEIAAREGYDTLPVPGDVGGRFSVLSPVGLFSAAMCGIDIDALLAGAAAMRDRCLQPGFRRNPACVLAGVHHGLLAKGKGLHVMMPYSNRLLGLADWFRQLWAESLGKRADRAGAEVFAGATPVRALGATDQHSQVQLYREGPNDKLLVFLEVAKHPAEVRVPDAFADVPGLSYLRKAKLSKLLNAEKTATEYALVVSRRPSVTVKFDAITPPSVGEFFFLYEFTTSLMGELLNVDAYDQPAVELGKKASFALMGREGYEDMAKDMRPFTRVEERYLA